MKALVVDDDRVLADVISFTLRREGYEVIQAHDGLSALARWSSDNPDIVVLDVNLPKLDGFSVCRSIREKADTPIILLTVRGEEDDIVQGLDIGADDYIVKPFSPRQLVARIKAILRRAGQIASAPVLQVNDLQFDPNQRVVITQQIDGVSLTPLENYLLEILMINAGLVMTSDAIIDHVWGPGRGDRDMLRQLVRRLRNKIEPDPTLPIYIKTVPGLGYGLVKERKKDP